MTTGRMKHPHPALKPPRSLWRKWYADGRWHKEKIGHEVGDEGEVINGRIYTYHPTKGWRNRAFV